MALSDITYNLTGEIKCIQWNWTSDDRGNYSQQTLQTNSVDAFIVNGLIDVVEFIPSAIVAPTTLYDVTLLDSNNIDVLQGYGTDLSASDSKHVKNLNSSVLEALTLVIINAGVGSKGIVKIYYR